MNGRERIQAALSPQGTPEFGAVIPYEGIFIRDHWPELSDKPWWVRISPADTTQLEWRFEIAQSLDQDWFDLPSGIPDHKQDDYTIYELNGITYLHDKLTDTKQILQPPNISGWIDKDNASIHPANSPDTFDEIDDWMEDWSVPGQNLNDNLSNLPHRILEDWGANYYPMGYINAPLWSCYYMWGFAGMMTRIVDKPDLVRYAAKCFTESTLQQIRIYKEMGGLGLWLEDCMTDMVSPGHYHNLNLPFIKQITDEAHASKLSTFHYFCGDPTGKWDDLLQTGADALALEESKKGFMIDITDVVERVNGKMAVLGNLDSVSILEQGEEGALQYEIKRQIKAGKVNGNRFIMSLGSPVTPGTSVDRVKRYLEWSHELGMS